ncbi:YetF domain-containing protein [Jeotgalibacillus soli]|nr:DUF421 domain-containing protein [Jeotgalibacillus soli]
MDLLELIVRVLLSYFILLLLTRMIGRKEISEMSFINFVSAITIGSIASHLVVNPHSSIRNGIAALTGWALLTILTEFISLKSKKTRRLIEGEPFILIKNGMVMEKTLRKARMDINTFNSLLRKHDIFSITDVEYAIFEIDGTLSVMKKKFKEAVTKDDLKIKKTAKNIFPIATEIISDGKVNKRNLTALQLDINWLKHQLEQAGVTSISDVFYAEIQQDGSLYVDTWDDQI